MCKTGAGVRRRRHRASSNNGGAGARRVCGASRLVRAARANAGGAARRDAGATKQIVRDAPCEPAASFRKTHVVKSRSPPVHDERGTF